MLFSRVRDLRVRNSFCDSAICSIRNRHPQPPRIPLHLRRQHHRRPQNHMPRRKHQRARIKKIVRLRTAASQLAEPSSQPREPLTLQQPPPEREPLRRMFARQRSTSIEPCKSQFRMRLMHARLLTPRDCNIDLDDLRPDVPGLFGDAAEALALAPLIRAFPVILGKSERSAWQCLENARRAA